MISNTIRNRVIAVSTDNHGISYSDDNGHTFTLSNITTGSFDKAIYNNNGIAVTRAIDKGNNNSVEGILYSEDGGATWTNILQEYWFSKIVHLNNNMMFACDLDSGHTYFTSDGKNWEIASNLMEEYLITQRRLDLTWEQNLAANRDTGRNLREVFHCSTLQETCQLLQEKANNRDYSGLSPCGDYIDIDAMSFGGSNLTFNENTQNLRFVVAGLGIYDGVGDIDSGPGIVFIEKNVCMQKRMDSENGTKIFTSTELGTACANAVAGLQTKLGVTLKTVNRGYDGSWQHEKIFLPTEGEVFGDRPWSNDYGTWNTSIIWPIFSKCPQSRIKYHQSNVGERRWWWTANKSSTSGCYTFVYIDGGALDYSATNTFGSVVLAFSL